MKVIQRPLHQNDKMQKQPTALLASEVAGQARLRNRTRSTSESPQCETDSQHRHSIAGTNRPLAEKNVSETANSSDVEKKVVEKTPLFVRKFTQRKKKESQITIEDRLLEKSREELRKELKCKLQQQTPLQKRLSVLVSPKEGRKFSWPESSLIWRNSKTDDSLSEAEGSISSTLIGKKVSSGNASIKKNFSANFRHKSMAKSKRSFRLILSPKAKRKLISSGSLSPTKNVTFHDVNLTLTDKERLCLSISAQGPFEVASDSTPVAAPSSAPPVGLLPHSKSFTTNIWNGLVTMAKSAFGKHKQNGRCEEYNATDNIKELEVATKKVEGNEGKKNR